MKPIFYILIALSFCCKPDLELVKMTSQRWSGGMKGSGSGTNFNITLIAGHSSEKMNIDKLWIGDMFFQVEAQKKFPARPEEGFEKNDTIYVYTTLRRQYNNSGQLLERTEDYELEPLAQKHEGVALLSYTLKGKRKYFVIEEIEKLKSINYP